MNNASNNIKTNNEYSAESELSLVDLVDFFRQHFRLIFGSLVLGAIFGFCLTLIIPAQWESSALVRVGQLGNSREPLEPVMQTVDRINNTSFKDMVMKKLNISQDEDDKNNKLFRESLKAKLEKSNLINIKLRSFSEANASLQLGTLLIELKTIHSKLLAPTTTRWKTELTNVTDELTSVHADYLRLSKVTEARADSLSANDFAQTALAGNILIARQVELKQLRERKLILEEYLSPEQTFDTSVIGDIQVTKESVYPKKTVFIVAGLLLGFLLGLIIAILANLKTRL